MRRSTRTRAWAALAAALLTTSLAPRADAQFVAPEGSAFHNGSTLPLDADPSASALLRRLEQAVSTGDGDEIATVVAGLRARRTADLVPFGPRTHVPVLDRALRLVVERASPAVRERVEADARVLVAEAARFRDLDALLSLATRERALDASRDAQLAAARLLFEEGRWWECARLARRAGDRPGAAELAAAAEARLPVDEDLRHAGPWRWSFAFQLPMDLDEVGLPLVLDGRLGETLVLDARALHGLDLPGSRATLETTFGTFPWRAHLLEPDEFRMPPAPRNLTAARRGSRVVLPYNLPDDPIDPRRRSPPTVREARLAAVELVGEQPVVAWQVRGPPSRESAAFGPPRIVGDRVFVQRFQVGLDTLVSLLAYRLSDGALLFDTPLVRGASIPRFASRLAEVDVDDFDKRARGGVVAERDGTVWTCTEFGVVAAVDGVTGALLATFRYDRLFSLDRGDYDRAMLFDTGGWRDEPVRLVGGRVVVAPSDSRFLYMLATEPGPGGHLIREDPVERLDRLDVAAVLPPPADDPDGAPQVVATRRRDNRASLVRLSGDGRVLGTSPSLPPTEQWTGRPLHLGDRVVAPSTAGLRVFDLRALDRPSTLLPQPPGLPPVRAVHATAAGLVGLCPTPDPGWFTDAVVHFVYWRGEP